MFPIRTEGTHVARRIMNKTMSNHLILPLESLPAFTPRTTLDTTVMRSMYRMDIGVGIQQILQSQIRLRSILLCLLEVKVGVRGLLEFEMAWRYSPGNDIDSHQFADSLSRRYSCDRLASRELILTGLY